MNLNRVLIKPRLKKNHGGLKATWTTSDGVDLSTKEIANELIMGVSFDVDLVYEGKYKDRYNKYKILLNLIHNLEKHNTSLDQSFTRRILNNGGLVAYAKKLENRK